MIHVLMSLALSSVAVAKDAPKKKDPEAPRVLIKGEGRGGYGAPVFGVAVLNGEPGFRVGGRGGWVITQSFVLGGYGESFSSSTEAGEQIRLSGGGLFFEGILAARSPVHATLEGGFGVGSVAWGDTAGFGFIPYAAVRLELNLVTWLRASLGPSVQGIIASGVLPDDVSPYATGAEVVFKFGAF